MPYNIAVIGATGNVGRELLAMLAERDFPVSNIDALASSQSIGKEVSFGDSSSLRAQNLDNFDFSSSDIVFACAGAEVSARVLPSLSRSCPLVIDNSSHFRMHKDVPLVIPEVNGEALQELGNSNRLVSNPNCSTIISLLALAPLHRLTRISRVQASTYQSVSGGGRAAMDELFSQTKKVYINESGSPQHHTKRIAFNVIPHIDKFLSDGFTKEEWKMSVETKKILDSRIELVAHCVRVSVFIGHAIALFVEFEGPIDIRDAKAALRDGAGVSLLDEPIDGGYVTPVDCAGEDDVYVSRLRKDFSRPNSLVLWAVGDNLRKGAALNAVQIAERAISDKIL